MGWQVDHDVDEFTDAVWPFLAADPAENTVALTLLSQLTSGSAVPGGPNLYGWHQDLDIDGGAAVTGAVCMVPPHPLLLAAVPAGSEPELASAVLAAGTPVPGVTGRPETVERFAGAWSGLTGQQGELGMRQRLYAVEQVAAPTAAGSARLARVEDIDQLAAWFEAFCIETGTLEPSPRAVVAQRVADEGVWLWEDPAGASVAFATRRAIVAGSSRVGPVYTPPAHRGHGYGRAVTAACTQAALSDGAQVVVLFTDLANPTSNAIYQQIGYRAVSDRVTVRFPESGHR